MRPREAISSEKSNRKSPSPKWKRNGGRKVITSQKPFEIFFFLFDRLNNQNENFASCRELAREIRLSSPRVPDFHFQWRNESNIMPSAKWWNFPREFQAINRSDDEYKWKVKCSVLLKTCLVLFIGANIKLFLMIFHFFFVYCKIIALVLVMIHKNYSENTKPCSMICNNA
jgi:hypothetical protein